MESAKKSKMMTEKFNESPQDKHKAKYGETHQANYLINAKGSNSKSKGGKVLFNDRTNASVSAFDGPVSPFRDNSHKVDSIRDHHMNYDYSRKY